MLVQAYAIHHPAIARAGCLTMGIVDPGSVNIGTFDADGQPSTHDTIYQNSNADVRFMVDTCAALGVPTVGVFGPTNALETHPVGARATFVKGVAECSPCRHVTCPIDHRCMTSVLARAVVDALLLEVHS